MNRNQSRRLERCFAICLRLSLGLGLAASLSACPDWFLPPAVKLEPYREDPPTVPYFTMPTAPTYTIPDFSSELVYSGLEFDSNGELYLLYDNSSGAAACPPSLLRCVGGTWQPSIDLQVKTGYDFFPYDLALDATTVYVLSSNYIYRLARADLTSLDRLTTGLSGMQGLAVIGSHAYFTVWQDQRIWRLTLPAIGGAAASASVCATLPPHAGPRGLTASGGKLYVADYFHDVIYQIDPASGDITDEFITGGRESLGLGNADGVLYMRDSGTATIRPLYWQRLDEWRTRSEPIDVTVRFRALVSNSSGLGQASARVTTALPAAGWRQDLVNLSFQGNYTAGTDRYGQDYARLETGSIAPGASASVGWTAQVRLWSLKVRVPDSRLVNPATADANLRGHFLTSSFSYLAMSSPTVTTFAASVGEAPANFALFARALRDKVFQALSYQLDSVWDNADVVLQRGSGSCSEYSFVTSAAWRLNGYPTRFVGASTGRNALASGQPDRVHHRWIEIFAPGIGWVPMDCNHNDSGSLTPFSNELVFGNASYYLELLKGGCEDNDWLGRGYTWSYATTSGTVDVDGAYEWSWR